MNADAWEGRRDMPEDFRGEGMDRRRFLQLLGASLALAGLGACGRSAGRPGEEGELLPYARAPEGEPGGREYFATTFVHNGEALGVLAETHQGRPTKIEGNPEHPASLGATDLFAQASILDLYDPARSRAVMRGKEMSDWAALQAFVLERREAALRRRGEGLRILTGRIDSPSLEAQLDTLLTELPQARWHAFEPVGDENARAGAEMVFGPVIAVPDFSRADVVAAFDADFLAWGGGTRQSRGWAERRRLRDPQASMSRLYAAEAHLSLAGCMADHRLPVAPSRVGTLLRAVAAALGEFIASGELSEDESRWVQTLAADLRGARGRSLVCVGEGQPPWVHALGLALNARLGNIGVTLGFRKDPWPRKAGSLAELAADMRAGKVETLAVLDCNPAYAGPADVDFASALTHVPHSIHLGSHHDETGSRSGWHVPMAHYLEAWGDARSADGAVSFMQPMIEPLGIAKTPAEMLALLQGRIDPSPRAMLEAYWRAQAGVGGAKGGAQVGDKAGGFADAWKQALRMGFLPEPAPQVQVSLRPDWTVRIETAHMEPAWVEAARFEIEFRPDPTVWDGRFAFNVWLQETPKPVSKLAWGNAVFLSPADAAVLGVKARDEVELRYRGRSVRGPAWILPGQCEGVATVTLGYGRAWPGLRTWVKENGGFVEADDKGAEARDMVYGFDAYALRTSDAPWHGAGLEIRKTGAMLSLANAQVDSHPHERPILHAADRSQLAHNARPFTVEEPASSLYPSYAYAGRAWGMSIDTSVCTGCSACVTACRAENNVPVVGKEGMLRHRDMAWLRIDRYFTGGEGNPDTYFQPMLCQHCENAPCEVVCPVEATLHDGEGLNEMIYNRCIGTRYCSNNCPYKVRRFNFFAYVDRREKTLMLQRNPDVTVRDRGVMEKCSFCVQRISRARIRALEEDREIRDGEATTACMQACPTGAIVFGDLHDKRSRVAAERAVPWNYAVLGELNTRPRVRYLARLWNLNQALEPTLRGLPL